MRAPQCVMFMLFITAQKKGPEIINTLEDRFSGLEKTLKETRRKKNKKEGKKRNRPCLHSKSQKW